MIKGRWIVGDYSVRPAGDPNKCFYCQEKVGEEHKADCVIRSRTVVMDFTFRLTIDVPESWDAETCEFCKGGGSSYCSDNIIDNIEYAAEQCGCSCSFMTPRFIREATEEDEKRYPCMWDQGHLGELVEG